MPKFNSGDKVRVLPYNNIRQPDVGIDRLSLRDLANKVLTVDCGSPGYITQQWYSFLETQFQLPEEFLEAFDG